MPVTTLHVSDLRDAGAAYELVFDLTPTHGPATFNGAGWTWSEWERSLAGGEVLTVRLVQANGDATAFPADDFGRFVVSDIDSALERASRAGFKIVSTIEAIDSERSIFRARDTDNNRIVVGNASLWVRKQETAP